MKDQGQIHHETFDAKPIGVFEKVFSGAEITYQGKAIRYAFPDGSAIIEIDGQWDYEGDTPFSWN